MLDTGPAPLDARAAERARKALKFDGTINLGHVVTFVAAMIAAGAAWNGIDKRVAVLEESRTSQRERDATQDQILRDHVAKTTQLLDKIDGRLDRIVDRMTDGPPKR